VIWYDNEAQKKEKIGEILMNDPALRQEIYAKGINPKIVSNFEPAFKKKIENAGYFSTDDEARKLVDSLEPQELKNLSTDSKAFVAENLVDGYISAEDKTTLAKLYANLQTKDFQPVSEIQQKEQNFKDKLNNDMEIQTARLNWNTIDNTKRKEILQKVADHHSDAYGLPKQKLVFKDKEDYLGSYNPFWNELVVSDHVNKDGRSYLDNVIDVFATAAHENTHRYQHQRLVKSLNNGDMKKTDDAYNQARLMKVNSKYYFRAEINFDDYQNQPMERHARKVGKSTN
jgi:hypothetical protein